MTKTLSVILIAVVACTMNALAFAAPHSVNLAWTDGVNPSGTAYNVYRATGVCGTTGQVFTNLTPIGTSFTTYGDVTVAPGPYCYQVTAVSAGVESAPSAAVSVTVPNTIAPPTGLSAVGK